SLYDYDLANDFYYRIDFTYDAANVITSATATKITTIPISANDIHKVEAGNGKFYVYDTYGPSADRMTISSDGGQTWTTRSVPESDEFFLLSNGYVFVVDGSDNKIHLSRDDGATFQESTLPSTAELWNLRDVALDESGYAYLAFTGDHMYQSANPIVIPQTPTSLQHAGYSATAAVLTWIDPNPYERDIVIERSVDGTTFTEVGQVDGWDACNNNGGGATGYYVDTNLQPATTYTYRVLARNQAGSSLPGATIAVTTLADCAPTLPENRSWSAINSGTEGYALLGAPVSVGIKHLGGGKYQISDLSLGLTGSAESSFFYESCGETHVGYIDDANPNGNGSWNGTTLTLKWRACYSGETETITLTLNANNPAPAQPAALNAYVLSNTAIEINWPSAYYENSYVLERSTSAASGFAPIATIEYPATKYIDNGPLTEGTTYYYRIKALNANTTPQESAYSTVSAVPFTKPNFTIADNAMTNFSANATIASIWADFNNDGLDDYFTMEFDAENQMGRPLIFKNLGAGNYEAVYPTFGTNSYFWPSVADFDNDNYPDIALSGDGERVFDLFKGNGDLTFTKVPAPQLGDLAVIAKEVSSSSWADVNNDALLDIILLNQEDGSFTLYKQNADHSFTNIYTSPPSNDEPIMAIWSDYDNNGYQDVLLGNLDGQGGLYRNNGDETFTAVTGNGFTGANFFAAAWGDYNNDGHVDLFCGTVSKNALFKNNGDGTFTEDLTTSISEGNFTISASWGDFNNDGYLDLITAGFPGYQTRLFIRDPAVTSGISFKKIVTEKLNDISVSHYSVAAADPDQNGLLDVMLSAFIFDDNNGDALSPTNNNYYQNNNPVRNWSEVKLKGKTGNAESVGAKITLTAGGKTQTREVQALSSLLSRKSTVAHFGLGSESTITNIQVRWPNGGIQNYPVPPVNQVLVIEEDLTGPTLTGKTPTHNSVDVSTTTALTLTFDENVFPVNGKQIEITKVGESTAIASIDASAGTKNGDEVTYSLPVTLEGETLYRVTIEAGAFRDRWFNASAAVGPLEWRFTTARAIDTTAPTITFTVPNGLPKGFGTVNPSITVTDDFEVASVVVSIRKISGSAYTDVSTSAGAATDTYTVQLSEATHFDAIGAEFYITATDLSGNTKRDPVDPTATHKVYLSYTAAQAAIPTTSLGLGGQKGNWKVFAIPFDIPAPNNGVSAIFNEIASTNDKTKFRLITYGTPTKWSEYPDAFAALDRGTGYFINIKEDPGAIAL
ncbi:MAG TPA: FG-GAP-like repeat-containing protein, partial [Chryseosolibacter sp.]|nr:FG-GAP-like repeat-containing protein [Chryseosolibacter sp.]